MNILVEALPNTVKIAGAEVEIRPDFRNCLRIILAFEDDELTSIEKQTVLLKNLYPEIPEDIQSAVEQGVKFLNGGAEAEESEDTPMRLYSFSKDAGFIFSAFRQTHNIDLEVEVLHWWKFLTLFMDLGAETVFCNLTSLRKRLKTGKATKEEKEAAREMGDLIEVPEPDLRSSDEKQKDMILIKQEDIFMQSLGKGKR